MLTGIGKAYILGTLVGEVVKEGYQPEWTGHIRVNVKKIEGEEIRDNVLKVNLRGPMVKNCATYIGDGSEIFIEADLTEEKGIVATKVKFL